MREGVEWRGEETPMVNYSTNLYDSTMNRPSFIRPPSLPHQHHPPLEADDFYGGASPSTVLQMTDSSSSFSSSGATTTDFEALCWGCGLRIVLPSNVPIFKCGWCGAITNQKTCKHDNEKLPWRRVRDRFFVCILLTFICFVICGGVWAVYPVVFSVSNLCGVFHCTITFILAVATLSMFCLAAFKSAGSPSLVIWGSYPVVGKGDLENYTFCQYCSKPKPSGVHHCRSCKMCVVDMDHHCPFIGNCVGAANHRYFVMFLISAITSMVYVAIMTAYAVSQTLPPIRIKNKSNLLRHGSQKNNVAGFGVLKEIFLLLIDSEDLFSPRKLLLVYLFVASVSVQIGLVVLLWQQLCYIYEGTTYLSSLNSSEDVGGNRDCQNFIRFFGCTHITSFRWFLSVLCKPGKIHKK